MKKFIIASCKDAAIECARRKNWKPNEWRYISRLEHLRGISDTEIILTPGYQQSNLYIHKDQELMSRLDWLATERGYKITYKTAEELRNELLGGTKSST
jgi:hypothetical protein